MAGKIQAKNSPHKRSQNGKRKHCRFCAKLLNKMGHATHEKWCEKNPAVASATTTATNELAKQSMSPVGDTRALADAINESSKNSMLLADSVVEYVSNCDCAMCQILAVKFRNCN